MNAICVLTNSSDYRYRGVHFVEPSEEEQETVLKAIQTWYDPEVAPETVEEEVQEAEYFFVDPAVVARLQGVELPSVDSDKANDALGDLMIDICRAFEVEG